MTNNDKELIPSKLLPRSGWIEGVFTNKSKVAHLFPFSMKERLEMKPRRMDTDYEIKEGFKNDRLPTPQRALLAR